MEDRMMALSREKIRTAEQLYNFIHEPTEKLDR